MDFYKEMFLAYEHMLDVRESLGYSRTTYRHYIPEFISYCSSHFPNASEINREMFEKWLLQRNFPSNRTYDEAISKIRVFTRYLTFTGYLAYIPDGRYHKAYLRYVPYILSKAELRSLFCSIDNIGPDKIPSGREYIFPVLFRMMYCCGLRPTEPLRLRCEDVNLQNGEVFIRQTKGNKDRRIMMSDDLLKLCRVYDSRMDARKYFFQHWNGGMLNQRWVLKYFHKCFESPGFPQRKRARPYDLRHTFATNVITRWMEEKQNVMAMLPYLAVYMGHVDVHDTLYYIHLIPENLLHSSGIDWNKFSGIYEEVPHEEN